MTRPTRTSTRSTGRSRPPRATTRVRRACLPFTAGRGFSAGLRAGRLVVKGAPEVVLDRCADAADARERVERLAAEGLRVIAVADRSVADGPDDLTALDLDGAARDLTLRGLVALADGVRESTRLAVAQLRAAGVRVLVATGDHPETASAIAAEAGIPDADRVVTGAELLRASDAERVRLVRETAVFARLSPEQKVALVAALRKAGATLAMTGDGVNDAAAIRLADVGVGVGGAGGAESPAARRSADLVLTDADLTRLVDALAEGRAMWARVRDAVAVLVGGNAGEVAFTVLGTALGGRSPLGTRQLLLVNLLTDMFPALAVAVAAPRRRRRCRRRGRHASRRPARRPSPGRGAARRPAPRLHDRRPPARAGPGCGHGRGRDRRVGDRPGDRLTQPRGLDGPGRADRHPARADGVGGAPQPAGAAHRRRVVRGARRRRADPGGEPVLPLPPARPVRVGGRARLVGRRRGGGGTGAALVVAAGRSAGRRRPDAHVERDPGAHRGGAGRDDDRGGRRTGRTAGGPT